MHSRYVDRDAETLIARYAGEGVARDLALRVYTTRLLGADPKLVLHGGGNTSVKTRLQDLVGEEAEVLCIKGSGFDMAAIEPAGFAAVRLAPLRTLRARELVSDRDLVRIERANLIDPTGPNPSVEVLLHAFLPGKFIDHTHASAVLGLLDQPDGGAIAADLFGERLGIVPYVRPGFALAKAAAGIFEENPRVGGLILDKHGIFTFGDDAREAYERMVDMVSLAEVRLARGRKPMVPARALPPLAPLADVMPIIRGACSLKDETDAGTVQRQVLDFRTSPAILDFVGGAEVARYSQAGVVTPDYAIRIKPWPLLLDPPAAGGLAAFREHARAAAAAFVARYRGYFAGHDARAGGSRRMLDPLPRVALVPGLGLFGFGRSKREARIAADIAESSAEVILDAEAIGRFQSIAEAEMFAMEYWPLERAKLGDDVPAPLAGQVAVVTGAGGAIGAATAQAFARAGAEVALLDVNEAAAAERARAIGGAALAVECDVTDAASVRAAFAKVVEAFGGVDIVVSNAGAAWQGRIGEVDEAVLRQSFELNFYGHQRVAQAAVTIMLAQGTGGCLLFNVSKQAVNPGPNFGPYGLPKAATLFLVRQYALDYGADGIRANAVNADRIRSGLLTGEFIGERAKARGISEKEYMSGNLLGREVTAEDVAQAFLHQALQLKTTADVTTVDGGNIAAALR
jgi:rhamnose utilization protein RhaD (predicted bifunctional aldolase and dehydrogenase)/NAD(P)-dependent dehydrogenase (short-subunit alcohol dehydrogenase family)